MHRLPRQICLLFCLFTCQELLAITPADLPTSFNVSYEFFKNGIPVAERHYTFKRTSNTASLTAITRLTGFAALFSDDNVSETSQFNLAGDHVQVVTYNYLQTGSKNLTIRSEFNIEKQLINTSINNNPAVVTPYTEMTWDQLSSFILLMSAVGDDVEEINTQIIDKGEIRQYNLKKTGNREIELDDDTWVNTVTWERHGPRKAIKFYLDPSAHYLPVKIQQYKDTKLRATLLLKSIKWH